MTELNPYYDRSRTLVQGQIDAIPGQADAEVAGLDAKLTRANSDILDGARRRGLGFSGIPVAEQAQYAATDYAPAVARTRSNAMTQRTTLMEALNGLGREQRTQGQSILDTEMARELQQQQLAEQQRQFNENLAFQKSQAASAGSGISLGGGGGLGGRGGGEAVASAPVIQRSANGGFNFYDPAGKPITAAAYAAATGTPFRTLLARMAGDGDSNARLALNYVGDDAKFGNAPVAMTGALGALGASGNFGNTDVASQRSRLTAARGF